LLGITELMEKSVASSDPAFIAKRHWMEIEAYSAYIVKGVMERRKEEGKPKLPLYVLEKMLATSTEQIIKRGQYKRVDAKTLQSKDPWLPVQKDLLLRFNFIKPEVLEESNPMQQS